MIRRIITLLLTFMSEAIDDFNSRLLPPAMSIESHHTPRIHCATYDTICGHHYASPKGRSASYYPIHLCLEEPALLPQCQGKSTFHKLSAN